MLIETLVLFVYGCLNKVSGGISLVALSYGGGIGYVAVLGLFGGVLRGVMCRVGCVAWWLKWGCRPLMVLCVACDVFGCAYHDILPMVILFAPKPCL